MSNIFRNIAIISIVVLVMFLGIIYLGTPSEMQQFCTWLGETKAGSTYEGCMAGNYSNSDYEMWIGFTG
mgnify:CR=1 FL=1|jgi:hypothetical protein